MLLGTRNVKLAQDYGVQKSYQKPVKLSSTNSHKKIFARFTKIFLPITPICVPPIFDKIQRFESLVNLEVVVSPVFDGYFALGLPVLDYTGL